VVAAHFTYAIPSVRHHDDNGGGPTAPRATSADGSGTGVRAPAVAETHVARAAENVAAPALRPPAVELPSLRPALAASVSDAARGQGGGGWVLLGCGLVAMALVLRRFERRTSSSR
jgi:hypothetical protein